MTNAPDAKSVKKILVFKFGGIGDYVNILPFLEDLRSYYPNSEISAVTSPAGKDLLENAGHVDKFVVSNTLWLQGGESIFSIAAIKDFFKIKRELEPPYDMYIDLVSKYSLPGTFKPWLFKFLSKAHFAIGLSYNRRGEFFLDACVKEDRAEPRHNIERYADILRELGWKPEFHLPKIIPSAQAERAATDFFADYAGKLKIALHPGANQKYFEHRAWPVERFAGLAEALKKNEPDCAIFVTGAKSENELMNRLINEADVKIVKVPQPEGIVDFCACLQKLDYYISNDTGPMHLAVAMNTPTVGIFGNADYNSYGTYPDCVPFAGIVLEEGRAHGPSPRCEDPRGLKKISVEDVLRAYKELKKKTE